MMSALFLDRDGVINVDHGYVSTIERCDFVDGIFDLVSEANRRNYLVIVVTNQAGIARGYYSEAQFFGFMEWMQQQFALQRARIDAIYFCPHHPEGVVADYKQICNCRKPGPGMLLRAAEEMNIDLASSIFIGDKNTDLYASEAAGVGRFLYFGSDCVKPALHLRSVVDYDRIFDPAQAV